ALRPSPGERGRRAWGHWSDVPSSSSCSRSVNYRILVLPGDAGGGLLDRRAQHSADEARGHEGGRCCPAKRTLAVVCLTRLKDEAHGIFACGGSVLRIAAHTVLVVLVELAAIAHGVGIGQ